jgi:5S rRNA maturation endonuclease (ribonuclease M5)
MPNIQELRSDLDKIKNAISQLLNADRILLDEDNSERSITHKLAEHLQCEFKDFDVDCEYNRDAKSQDGIKRIGELEDEFAKCLGKRRVKERRVYPDIIIHERRSRDQNRCIIEVKKTTSRQKDCYDLLKLRCYTGGFLGYQLGVFIKLIAKKPQSKSIVKDIQCFRNGVCDEELTSIARNMFHPFEPS